MGEGVWLCATHLYRGKSSDRDRKVKLDRAVQLLPVQALEVGEQFPDAGRIVGEVIGGGGIIDEGEGGQG